MLYTVYLLFSNTHQKIYIGCISNLINRFHSHNELSKKDWTRSFRPWMVIYCEYFNAKEEAKKRQQQLKGAKGSEWIWQKIEAELDAQGFISAPPHCYRFVSKKLEHYFTDLIGHCIPIRMQWPKFVIKPFNIECRLFRLDTIINV
jgi:putative endonuclease